MFGDLWPPNSLRPPLLPNKGHFCMPQCQKANAGGKITLQHTTLRHRSNKLPGASNSFLTSASPAAKGCINPSPRTTAAVVRPLIKERRKTDPHSTAPGQQRQKSSSTLLNACCHNFKKANDTEISSPALRNKKQDLPNRSSVYEGVEKTLNNLYLHLNRVIQTQLPENNQEQRARQNSKQQKVTAPKVLANSRNFLAYTCTQKWSRKGEERADKVFHRTPKARSNRCSSEEVSAGFTTAFSEDNLGPRIPPNRRLWKSQWGSAPVHPVTGRHVAKEGGGDTALYVPHSRGSAP